MKRDILIGVILVILTISLGIWVVISKEKPNSTLPTTQESPRCLAENERAGYEAPKESITTAEITIRDKNTNQLVRSFNIPDVRGEHYHAYEMHPCYLYVLRYFKITDGIDRIPNNIWRYDYRGRGEEIAKEKNDFRIDETETYIAYEDYYLDHKDYSLIIKNLKTGEAAFSIKLIDLVKQYRVQPGVFQLMDWGSRKLNEESLFSFYLLNDNSSTFGLDISTKEIMLASDYPDS